MSCCCCCCCCNDDDSIVTSPVTDNSNDFSLLIDVGVAADDEGGMFGLKCVDDEGSGVIEKSLEDDIIGLSFNFDDFADLFGAAFEKKCNIEALLPPLRLLLFLFAMVLLPSRSIFCNDDTTIIVTEMKVHMFCGDEFESVFAKK